MQKGTRKKLGVIFLSISMMVMTSACAATVRSSKYPVRLPRVEGVQWTPGKGAGKDRKCVVLTQEDLQKIVVEFVRACVALGNKPTECGVNITEKETPDAPTPR